MKCAFDGTDCNYPSIPCGMCDRNPKINNESYKREEETEEKK